MMAGIRGKDTNPEMRVRRALFDGGYRYRLHRRDLLGTPDIVLPGWQFAIFVNGCFWRVDSECSQAKVPSIRTEFWKEKFESNRQQDKVATEELLVAGWRVLVVWDCFTRGCKTEDALMEPLTQWIEGSTPIGELQSAV